MLILISLHSLKVYIQKYPEFVFSGVHAYLNHRGPPHFEFEIKCTIILAYIAVPTSPILSPQHVDLVTTMSFHKLVSSLEFKQQLISAETPLQFARGFIRDNGDLFGRSHGAHALNRFDVADDVVTALTLINQKRKRDDEDAEEVARQQSWRRRRLAAATQTAILIGGPSAVLMPW